MGIFRIPKRLRRALTMASRVSQLEVTVHRQSREIEYIHTSLEQADMLKSSLEVPTELVEEFSRWKAANVAPDHPLVSVCVATYNRGELLTERCIASILRQTYRNLELIVVGDCCTDDTEARIARIGDPRVRFVNLPQRGPYPSDPMRRWMVAGSCAMNHALALANGDFITHLDDDDEHLPDRLEKLLDFAKQTQSDFVWHPFWYEAGPDNWQLNNATRFAFTQITTSSVFYRSWFKRITWNLEAHRLLEPGDWNRFRRIKFIGPAAQRFPEPLLRHYVERQQIARPR